MSIELGLYSSTEEINSVPFKKKKRKKKNKNGTVVTFILHSYRESKDLFKKKNLNMQLLAKKA